MQDLSPFYIWTPQLEASRRAPEGKFFEFHPTIFESHPLLNSSRAALPLTPWMECFEGIQSCLAD